MISVAVAFGKLLSDKRSEGAKRGLPGCLPGWCKEAFLSQGFINFRNGAGGKEKGVCTTGSHTEGATPSLLWQSG